MSKQASELITMLRNVTGRVDSSDPLFTDAIMLQYLNDFLSLESTQDIRIIKDKTWWTFNLTTASADPYPVVLENLVLDNGVTGASTIGGTAYASGYELFWYQDPREFFRIWPETQTYSTSRPTYVLWYNNELVFRSPPDQTYNMKIEAYSTEVMVTVSSPMIADYLYRYAVYGAALNIFSDYGEMDKYNEIYPVYMRHRNTVYNRTYQQMQNQRTSPEF